MASRPFVIKSMTVMPIPIQNRIKPSIFFIGKPHFIFLFHFMFKWVILYKKIKGLMLPDVRDHPGLLG